MLIPYSFAKKKFINIIQKFVLNDPQGVKQ